MRVGDTIENAIWLTGTEPPEMRAAYERQVRESIAIACHEQGVVAGPVRVIEKRPGDDRVPPVPDHISGPDVRLLVIEADVICRAPEINTRGFVGELEQKDLARLRNMIRQRARNPALLDEECDDLIEELGPAAALATLEVYGSTVH